MWKLSPNLKVRPVILWPSLIILLVTSVTFYILKEKEVSLRIKTQKQLAKTVLEKRAFENELTTTLRKKEIVQKQLISEKERSLSLEKEVEEKEKELEEKNQQIKLTLDKLEKEIIARRFAEIQLIMAVKEKRKLMAKVWDLTEEVPKAVDLKKIVVKATSELIGKVLVVNKEQAFIVVDLGKANNLKVGDVLSVYRSDEFIGRVQVEKVEQKVSAAAIMPQWRGVEFQENDDVKKI